MENPFLFKWRGYLLAFSLLSSPFAHAQDVLWEKSYGGRHAEYLMDAVPTADYGFILAGSSLSDKSGNKTSKNEGDLDYWVWKMDEKGEMEWQKSFGGSGTDFLQGIKNTQDGGFILAGNSDSPKSAQKNDNSHGGNDFWVIKLNAGGGEQWQKTIGGSGDDRLQSVCQTKDGGFILGGSSSSDKSNEKTTDSYGNMDYWVVKLDKDGNVEWEKTFGGKYFDELRSIEQTRDNGYILGGYSNSPQSGNKRDDNIGIGDYWVLKLDRKGETEWEKVIGGDKDDQLYTVHQTYDGGFILGGNSNSQATNSKSKGNGKGTDFWIVKLDTDGEMQWQETYDFGSSDILTSIVENRDHTFLVGGFAKSEAGTKKDDKGINDYIALKISEKGVMLWDRTVGSDGDDALKKLIETRDGGYILAGTSNPVRSQTPGKSKKSKSGKGPGVTLGNGEPNKQMQNTTNGVNEQLQETTDSVNEAYDETVGGVADKINKATDTGDSPLKFGVNKPNSPLGKAPSIGGGTSGDALGSLMDGLSNGKDNLPASGDKKRSFGNSDFWVVKLRDKSKTEYSKEKSLEAMPNPTSGFTNVIVNYEYESGTATVVDLSGHVLKQFEISGRT
ncbi:MAG TPA: hypothetical protein VK528_09985, partial [Flavobacterium sp.]|nr:hypothetical protein [Flavobacterium sp.]